MSPFPVPTECYSSAAMLWHPLALIFHVGCSGKHVKAFSPVYYSKCLKFLTPCYPQFHLWDDQRRLIGEIYGENSMVWCWMWNLNHTLDMIIDIFTSAKHE